jgi:hypothetical protein
MSNRFLEIADRFEPRIRNALNEAFAAMKDRAPINTIVDALETRGIDGVMSLLRDIGDDLGPVVAELDAAILESGRATISLVPGAAVINQKFVFDLINPNTVDFIRQYRLNLIQQISNATREAVRNGLQADIISGRNPRDTARTFRANLGLTARQERAVRNFRTALEELDPRALDRALRDKRFDRTIIRAIESETNLTSAQIDKMVNRYRERYIKYRSETIARTEAMRATTVGQRASIRQMVLANAVEGQRIRRFWVYTRDKRTRIDHRLIPSLNEQGVDFADGVYQTPEGPLRFPRDPNGTGANTINCRCTERFELVED